MRRSLAFLLLIFCVAAAAAGAQPPALGAARLEGGFLLSGVVTTAKQIPGERAGQQVSRAWTFTPTCVAGQCPILALLRARASGADQLTLQQRSPGVYSGRGRFFAPLRCGSTVYPQGAAVPFTITVQITAARVIGGVLVATRITATYLNIRRTNRTPCVAVLGHDAANYHGHVVLPLAPTGGAAPSAQSPAGS